MITAASVVERSLYAVLGGEIREDLSLPTSDIATALR
jgi:hypothetical protein